MYNPPIPMDLRTKCEKCEEFIRFHREDEDDAIDLYSCGCHIIYSWNGKKIKLEPLKRLNYKKTGDN